MYADMKRMSLMTQKHKKIDEDEIMSCLFYRILKACPI